MSIICPECELIYGSDVAPYDYRYHKRVHAQRLAYYNKVRQYSGCEEYSWPSYETLKSQARGVFNGYDGLPHTQEEILAAAIAYLRVRCARSLWGGAYATEKRWAHYLALYPDFAAWVRDDFKHCVHEFSPWLREALIAHYSVTDTGEEE